MSDRAPEADPQAGTDPNDVNGSQAESVLDEELPASESFPRDYVTKLRKEAATSRTKARELETFIQAHGGKDRVERLMTATQTSEGVAQLFYEAGRAFGLSQTQLEQLLTGGSTGSSPQAGQSLEDDLDADEPLTKKQLEAILAEKFEKEVRQPISRQREADLAASGAKVIHDTLESLGAKDDDQKRAIMRYVADFMPEAGAPDEFNPDTIARAVRSGHESFTKDIEKHVQGYLSKKERARSAPAGLGTASSSPTFQLPSEPKNSREATKVLQKWLADHDE